MLYDGIAVPGSPFTVNARRGCDPRKVKAFGPGLERGLVNQSNVFTIETKGEQLGRLMHCANQYTTRAFDQVPAPADWDSPSRDRPRRR